MKIRFAVLALFLASCGGRSETPEHRAQTTGGDQEESQVQNAGAAETPVPGGDNTATAQGQRNEPQVEVHEVPSDPSAGPRDDVPGRYLMVDLPAGAHLRPPATACQDVLLFVRAGTLVASGTGIAERAAPLTLYAGDAVRFGPEGDGEVRNDGAAPARTVLVVARDESAGPVQERPGVAMVAAPSADAQRCPVTPPPADARFSATRVAHVDTTSPLSAAGGKLQVRILLDQEGQGATRGALSWLDGAADVAVPSHRHDTSAELLLIEDGDGTMHVGDHEVHVTAGSAVYVPRGVQHDFRSSGTRPLHAVQVYTPGGPEQRFRAAPPPAPAHH